LPEFYYEAYLQNGRTDRNTIVANDRHAAHAALSSAGKMPFVLKPVSEGNSARAGKGMIRFPRRTGKAKLQRLFIDLSVLLNSGFTIDQAIAVVTADRSNNAEVALYREILDNLKEGRSVSEAFDIGGMPGDITALIAAGENSGRLAEVFSSVAQRFDETAKRKSELLESLLYPVFLLCMVVVALFVLAFFLVPAIEPIFEASGAEAPTIIAVLSTLRDFFTGGGLLVFLVWLAGLAVMLSLPTGRTLLTKLIYKLPFVGPYLIRSAAADYLRVLGLLLANGVNVKRALQLASGAARTASVRAKFNLAEEAVTSGTSLHQALSETGLFTQGQITQIRIGEESDNLPAMLDRCASITDRAQKTTLDRVMTFITPAVTIGMGLLIGTLVISVMSTLLSINDLALQ
jgi:general secretion pathway protein F